nr:response regulator transcription factor [uncultured Sphingomonas sp.]
MTTIVIADDHPLIRRGLRDLIAGSTDIGVLASCYDGRDALDALARHQPDLALLDVAMPDLDGLEVMSRIARNRWPIRVILLSGCIHAEQVVRAIAAGVHGIVLKDSPSADLLSCLARVAKGGRWLPHAIVQPAIRETAEATKVSGGFDMLTARERSVAERVAAGLSNREVADQLGLAQGTVKIHLHSIYAKLQVDNRTALAIAASRRPGPRARYRD